MKILKASAMGMCFGVRRAIKAALAQPDPASVTILGELVHNEEVLRQLSRLGFAMLPESDRERLPDTPRVMITAHGASDRDRARLRQAGKQIIDTTCPLVRRIHERALDLASQGYFILMIGKREHVEVRGVTGDLQRYEVLATPDEARAYDAPRLAVLCQSTAAPETAEAILAAIRDKNPSSEIHYEPTICRPTLDRQAAATALLAQVDALVVVGGRHSNNTVALVRQSIERGVPCLHVQSADDIAPEWLHGYETVGLTAGTSTPESTIESVYQRLQEIAAARQGVPVRQIA